MKNKFVPFLIGFLITFNFYIVIINSSKPPRVFDIIAIIFVVIHFVILFGKGKRIKIDVRFFLFLFLIVFWLIKDIIFVGLGSLLTTGRWLVISLFAYFLNNYYLNDNRSKYFIKGLIIGILLNIPIIIFQNLGYNKQLISLGLVSNESWESFIYANNRYMGLFEYPNAAAMIFCLAFPLSIILVKKYKCSNFYLYIGVALVLVSTFLTYTRTPLLISIIILIFWFFSKRSNSIKARYKIALICMVIIMIALFGLPGGESRWSNTNYITNNLTQRLESNLEAVRQILTNPLGMGSNYKTVVNYAVHNAYFQMALMAGIPFSIYLIYYLLNQLIKLIRYDRSEKWLLLFILGNLMFEEHLTNPTLLAVMFWVTSMQIQVIRRKSNRLDA